MPAPSPFWLRANWLGHGAASGTAGKGSTNSG